MQVEERLIIVFANNIYLGAKPNMERELVSNVTMDSTTTQIVSVSIDL